jgi:hypothetical protein
MRARNVFLLELRMRGSSEFANIYHNKIATYVNSKDHSKMIKSEGIEMIATFNLMMK